MRTELEEKPHRGHVGGPTAQAQPQTCSSCISFHNPHFLFPVHAAPGGTREPRNQAGQGRAERASSLAGGRALGSANLRGGSSGLRFQKAVSGVGGKTHSGG